MKIKNFKRLKKGIHGFVISLMVIFLGDFMTPHEALSIDIIWKRIATTEDHIVVYEGSVEGYSLVAFKGVAIIDQPLERVASVIYNEDRKIDWMDRVHGQYRIKKIRPGKTIVYNQTSLPWPVDNREFIYEMNMVYNHKVNRLDATLKNKEGFKKLQQEGTVRGVFLDSGFNLFPHDKGRKTKIEVRVMVDPKGLIPAWLVNLLQASWPENTIRGLRTQSKKLKKVDIDILNLMKRK